MNQQFNLIERIERLSGAYASARRELEAHPQYRQLQEMTQTELPADLAQMIQQYETARKGLEGERIVISSIVKLKETARTNSIDLSPADNGSKKLPEDWFDYWEKDSSNRIMASAGDLYQAWKQMKKNDETGNSEEKKPTRTLFASFSDDFNWPGKNNYLIGGTRIEYQPENLNATVTQHYRCKRKELVKTTSLEIEEYLGVPITKVASQEKGLRYLQVFFDTEDNAETIMQTLEFISEKARSEIKIWSAPVTDKRYSDTRKKFPNRAAGFDYDGVSFHVIGNDIYNAGRSRGVAVE